MGTGKSLFKGKLFKELRVCSSVKAKKYPEIPLLFNLFLGLAKTKKMKKMRTMMKCLKKVTKTRKVAIKIRKRKIKKKMKSPSTT